MAQEKQEIRQPGTAPEAAPPERETPAEQTGEAKEKGEKTIGQAYKEYKAYRKYVETTGAKFETSNPKIVQMEIDEIMKEKGISAANDRLDEMIVSYKKSNWDEKPLRKLKGDVNFAYLEKASPSDRLRHAYLAMRNYGMAGETALSRKAEAAYRKISRQRADEKSADQRAEFERQERKYPPPDMEKYGNFREDYVKEYVGQKRANYARSKGIDPNDFILSEGLSDIWEKEAGKNWDKRWGQRKTASR